VENSVHSGRKGGQAVLAGEPGDLVVELVQVRGFGIGENRARDFLKVCGDFQPRRNEGVVEGVSLAIYVEVSERDEVVVPTTNSVVRCVIWPIC
jgi:hypothetical protein